MNVSNAKQTSGDRYFAKTPFTARVSESLRSLFVSVLSDFISGGCVAKQKLMGQKQNRCRGRRKADEEEEELMGRRYRLFSLTIFISFPLGITSF